MLQTCYKKTDILKPQSDTDNQKAQTVMLQKRYAVYDMMLLQRQKARILCGEECI